MSNRRNVIHWLIHAAFVSLAFFLLIVWLSCGRVRVVYLDRKLLRQLEAKDFNKHCVAQRGERDYWTKADCDVRLEYFVGMLGLDGIEVDVSEALRRELCKSIDLASDDSFTGDPSPRRMKPRLDVDRRRFALASATNLCRNGH